jgi:hypothetical protein
MKTKIIASLFFAALAIATDTKKTMRDVGPREWEEITREEETII